MLIVIFSFLALITKLGRKPILFRPKTRKSVVDVDLDPLSALVKFTPDEALITILGNKQALELM
jgi:hypothetical protein